MKNYVVLLALFAILFSCTKEKTEISDTATTDSLMVTEDSMQAAASDSAAISGITVQDIAPEQGRAVFKIRDQALFYFDYHTQQGKITVGDKEYLLTRMDFTDNHYTLSGSGVEIKARNGEFSESSGDCIYGKFAEFTIHADHEVITLPGLNVQDCPVY
ncbi:hypothetical protein [Chryseobacterium sp. MFBS3-17]|uniref:hypothetical protein n=1 Tax=Chryseobacterium sp. MFBS3-17 TaxID=2886689 RepID=UPI001D0E9E9F|nr:hypothetical protein [Chryseobacterium sp. MFBS3-17]MCC2589451.1 hypothetical protein [Chryseobacterium sp. MFBS3-17]